MKSKNNKSILELLRIICNALFDKKAERVRIIDVSNLIKITDYFVICSAESTTQVGAIMDEVVKKAESSGFRTIGLEGAENLLWVLIDFGDVVVHVFHEPVRTFYDLDGLWQDAEEIDVESLLSKKRLTMLKKQ